MAEPQERLTALEWARTRAKWFFSAMVLVMVGALFFGLQVGQVDCGSGPPSPEQQLQQRRQEAVATVGADPISRSEYERQYRMIQQNFQNRSAQGTALADPMMDFQFRAQAVSSLISSTLLEQKALEYGLVPAKETVDERFRMYEAQLLPPLGQGTERSILQKVSDGLQQKKRSRQFAAAILDMTGMSVKEFRKTVELQIIQEEYEQVLQKEAEEAVKADALATLEGYRTEAEGGAEFATLAKEHSQDAETAAAGGRLDFISVAQMANDYGAEYVDTLRNTAPGTIARPIWSEVKNGYFLVKLDTFKRAEGPEFEAEKESVRQQILAKKQADAAADATGETVVDATEEEIRDAYESASLWQIFVTLQDPNARFGEEFEKLLDDAAIEVTDPDLKAGFLWMVRDNIPAAVEAEEAALAAAKEDLQTELATVTDADERESLELMGAIRQAEIHYVLGQLIASQPDRAEQERMQAFFAENQDFSNFTSFPEPTEEEQTLAEQQRAAALQHYETSYQLNPQVAWTPLALAQMLLRLEKTDRYPEAIGLVQEGLEYASRDLAMHQRAQQILTSLKASLDVEAQASLITEVDAMLAELTTEIADIQAAQEAHQKQQEQEMQALMGQMSPATQQEIPIEDPAAAPAPVEGEPTEPAIEFEMPTTDPEATEPESTEPAADPGTEPTEPTEEPAAGE